MLDDINSSKNEFNHLEKVPKQHLPEWLTALFLSLSPYSRDYFLHRSALHAKHSRYTSNISKCSCQVTFQFQNTSILQVNSQVESQIWDGHLQMYQRNVIGQSRLTGMPIVYAHCDIMFCDWRTLSCCNQSTIATSWGCDLWHVNSFVEQFIIFIFATWNNRITFIKL